jgi:hypothetical protein
MGPLIQHMEGFREERMKKKETFTMTRGGKFMR